jgi:acetyltransferase-like isoleucine patch superfamily enzyme
MNDLVRTWRRWRHSRQFASVGKDCSFNGRFLEVDGHVELGDFCKIRNNIIMRTRRGGKILIEPYVGISYYCYLEATTRITIGSFTGIAEFTVIRDTNHSVMGTADHWRITPHIAEPIVIGQACMITSRCYIGPGVAIGDGAVIGPNSVVTKDVGPYEVWAGNPARKIAHRLQGVPETVRRRHEEFLQTYGLQEDRYGIEQAMNEIRELAEAGVNRAAEERDRLKREMSGEEQSPITEPRHPERSQGSGRAGAPT